MNPFSTDFQFAARAAQPLLAESPAVRDRNCPRQPGASPRAGLALPCPDQTAPAVA